MLGVQLPTCVSSPGRIRQQDREPALIFELTARARAPCKLLSLLLRCGLQGIIIGTAIAAV